MTTTEVLLAVVHRGLTVRLDKDHPALPVVVTVVDEDARTYSRVAVPDEAWADADLLAVLINRMADQVRPKLDPARLP